MNDQPMIGQLGGPSMSPEAARTKHEELNEKFGWQPPTEDAMTDAPISDPGDPSIDTYADDPNVPALLWAAFKQAADEQRLPYGPEWAELNMEWRAATTRAIELFAELVGWDQ